jgi:hypothetical protein
VPWWITVALTPVWLLLGLVLGRVTLQGSLWLVRHPENWLSRFMSWWLPKL